MDDLRFEIRAAFQKEQLANPPAANLRYSIVRSVTTRPRRETNLQRLAVAAALVIGLLVVVSLMSSRIASRPIVQSHPVGDYGAPPAGVALIYVADPAHAGWYIGFDWTGQPRGTIKLAQPLDQFSGLVQSPDGSGFAVNAGGKPDDRGETLDRLGKLQDNFPVPVGITQVVWADDNRHLCSMAFQNGNLMLSWHVPTYSSHVAVIAKAANLEQGGIDIVSCAFATDQRAVLVRQRAGVPTDFWIVGLGDGRVVLHQSIAAGTANVVGSHDGTRIAENSLISVGYRGGGAVSLNTLVRIFGGPPDEPSALGLDPAQAVLAFSGDDKVVLVSTSPWAAGLPTHLAAIELATGKVLWRYDGGMELAALPLIQPGGEDFVLFLKKAGDQDPHASIAVLIEHDDGTSTAVPGRYVQP